MAPLLKWLTMHWQLKLAAFALAVLLWVVLSAETVTTQWLPVPVQIEMRDPAYELAYGPVPEEVEVRFTGPGRELWELAINRPRLLLRVPDVDDDDELYVLTPQMVQVPRGLSASPQDVRPSSVRIGFTRLATREVPVVVPIGRGTQEGYTLVDSLIVRPARVQVSGEADRVAQVSALTTQPLDLSREDTVFVRRVALDTSGVGDLRFGTLAVEVSGQVDRIVERVIPEVAVTGPPGAAALPSRVSVRLRGPQSQLRRISAANLRVVAPLNGEVPSTGTTVGLRLEQVPPGVSAEVTPARVRLVPLLGTPAAPTLPGAARDTLLETPAAAERP
ncbi:MAG TPA: hypothetical protein VGR27_04165 [Longimicrobiaceae bacterium]|nr:hypothetical protein [Longimicrobiaceae bacterium]